MTADGDWFSGSPPASHYADCCRFDRYMGQRIVKSVWLSDLSEHLATS